MASGVEMLGQMSETDALAGPVQGGNMVVKPNEVPVGGAAMLAKALRGQSNKGVGGIYELPSQEQPTPEFMQMAQQGVKDDMTRMARTVEAEAPPGHMLSYITPEEASILQMLGGSGDIQPTTGIPSFQPPGYDEDKSKSAQDFKSKYSGGSTYNQDQRQSLNDAIAINDRKNAYQSMADAGISSLAGTTTDDKKGRQAEREQRKAGFTPVSDAAQAANKEQVKEDREEKIKQKSKVDRLKDELKKAQDSGNQEEINNLENLIKTESTFLEKLMADIAGRDKQIMEQGDLFDKGTVVKDKLIDQLKKLGIVGPEIRAIEDLPEDTQKEMFDLLGKFERLEVSPKEALNYMGTTFKSMSDGEFRDDEHGVDTKDLTLEGLTKRLRALDTGGGASVLESLRKYAPELHYKAFRDPQTSDSLESFGRNTLAVKDAEGNYKVDGRAISNEDAKRYNNAIFSAREQGRKNDNNNQGGGRPRFMEETEEEVIDTPTGVVDEEAQTMEYTSPRTGDVATSVPLNRRFQTDPTQDVARYRTAPRSESDIYKYMTEGTTGEGIGLEPFSEYQKRRRKAMGLEPLGLYG